MLGVGQWVAVRSLGEILATLDADDALESLPFMPEMLPFCGRTFRVALRAERTCARGIAPGERPIRRLDDAVVLEGLACDGSAHGGCQLRCAFFWKEKWLEPVPGPRPEPQGALEVSAALRTRQRSDPAAYYCQGTELARATQPCAPPWHLGQYLRMVRVGTVTPRELLAMYARVGAAWARRHLRRGDTAPVAPGTLGLKPGEWVEVKRPSEIAGTLDPRGTHRGLSFMSHYEIYCGRRMRVLERVERVIVEETGRLRTIRDTVLLEGATCPRHHGCARGMPPLWREAWLRRVEGPPPAIG
jgi:hypothetical protein